MTRVKFCLRASPHHPRFGIARAYGTTVPETLGALVLELGLWKWSSPAQLHKLQRQ